MIDIFLEVPNVYENFEEKQENHGRSCMNKKSEYNFITTETDYLIATF